MEPANKKIRQCPDEAEFPVTFEDFCQYTNVMKLAVQLTEAEKIDHSDFVHREKAFNLYKMFYTELKRRKRNPLVALKIFQCPEHIMLNIRKTPGKYGSHENELPMSTYPVALSLFLKCLDFDDAFKDYLLKSDKKLSDMQRVNLRQDFNIYFFKQFYKLPCVRHMLDFKFRPCPQQIKEQIMQRANVNTEITKDLHDNSLIKINEQQVVSLSTSATANNMEIVNQEVLPTTSVESNNNVVKATVCKMDEEALPTKSVESNTEIVFDKDKKVLPNIFAESNIKVATKTACEKSNGFVEDEDVSATKSTESSIEVTKSTESSPTAAQQVANNFFRIYDRLYTFAYAVRRSRGLKRRILMCILNMSFEDFCTYTRIYNGSALCDNMEFRKKSYIFVFKNEQIWPPILYMSLSDLLEFLKSQTISIDDDIDLQNISPKLLHYEELMRITNFDEIVRLDYIKETAKHINGDVDLLLSRRHSFYNRCWAHDDWLWEAPKLKNSLESIVETQSSNETLCIVDTPDIDNEIENQLAAMDSIKSSVDDDVQINYIDAPLQNKTPNERDSSMSSEDDNDTVIFPLNQFVAYSDIAKIEEPSQSKNCSEVNDVNKSIESQDTAKIVPFNINDNEYIKKEYNLPNNLVICLDDTNGEQSIRYLSQSPTIIVVDDVDEEAARFNADIIAKLMNPIGESIYRPSATTILPSTQTDADLTYTLCEAQGPPNLSSENNTVDETERFVLSAHCSGNSEIYDFQIPALNNTDNSEHTDESVENTTEILNANSHVIEHNVGEQCFSVSQALATDKTFFECSQLRRVLENVERTNIEKPNKSNNEKAASSLSSSSSSLQQVNQNSYQSLFFRYLQEFHYFDALTDRQIANYQIPYFNYGHAYTQIIVKSQHRKFKLGNECLKLIFPKFSVQDINDIYYVLKDLTEYHFDAFKLQKLRDSRDLRERVLDLVFAKAPKFSNCALQFYRNTCEFAKCVPTKDAFKDLPHRPLEAAIKSNILNKMLMLKTQQSHL